MFTTVRGASAAPAHAAAALPVDGPRRGDIGAAARSAFSLFRAASASRIVEFTFLRSDRCLRGGGFSSAMGSSSVVSGTDGLGGGANMAATRSMDRIGRGGVCSLLASTSDCNKH